MTQFRNLLLLFLCLGLLLTGSLAARAAELPPPEHVQIKLYSTSSTIAPGQPFTVIIEQLIEPHWHTYWKNPGDSGTPMNVKWTLPDGGTADILQEPIPSRIVYDPLVNFGYTDRALFSTQITPPTTIAGETFTVTADIDWLVCNDICLPEGGTYSLVLPMSGGTPDVNHNITDILRDLTATHPLKSDWNAHYRQDEKQTIITFTPSVQALEVLTNGGKVEFFPSDWGLIENAGEQVLAFLDNGQAALAIPAPESPRTGQRSYSGLFVIHDNQGHKQGYDVALNNSNQPVSNPVPPPENAAPVPVPNVAPETGTSLAGALVLALLGGIILNLMPCVFPVLSLKILSLAQLSGAERKHMRPHGIAYAAGVIITFLFVASTLMILQQSGAAIGWGFQLQQPIVIALLAYLFTLIGFNLMGWFEIDVARYIPARFHGHHDGLVGSFATGILATIVATPCTAPFMAAALGYALTHNAGTGLLVFAVLGLGLALPFVILTFIPRLYAYLPRPGAWMLTLRQALAFPMFITVLWLLWVLGHQTGSNGTALALLGILSIAFLLWLARLAPTKGVTRYIRIAFVLFAAFSLVFVTLTQNCNCEMRAEEATQGAATGQVFTPAALDQALATNQPVFVNMTAAWCITCKVNERIAIATTSTKALFAEQDVIYLKGDWTNYNADITAYLNQMGRKGVPLYVFYPSPDTNGTRPAPIILPQLLTPAILATTIKGEKL